MRSDRSRRDGVVRALAASAIAAAIAAPALAVAASEQDGALVRQAQNPIAFLLSLPLVNNNTFGVGFDERTQSIVALQPIIPFALPQRWSIVTRTSLPIVYQPGEHGTDGSLGLSDITSTIFAVAPAWGPVQLAFGPSIELPTAVNERVGAGKFALGPALAAVVQPDPWVLGVLVDNIFSLTGTFDTPYINRMTLQPFANYNFGMSGWYLLSTPIMTADWTGKDNQVWTVPVGGGVGKLFTLGSQPFTANIQGFYNAARIDGQGVTQLRIAIQMLLPDGW